MTIRVAIDARIPEGFAGGVKQVVVGLAAGFHEAAVPGLERLWITYPGHESWLDDHLPAGDEVVEWISPVERLGLQVARHQPRLVSSVRPSVERALRALPNRGGPPPADKALRARGVDAVHLTFQDGLRTTLPTVYHPHDLQHHYLPQFFSKAQIRHRETSWRDQAHRASAVSVGTHAAADDVMRIWGVNPEKVFVVPLGAGAPAELPERPDEAVPPLILYPAAFWPHKDHLTLVKAIGDLPDNLQVDLLLPGAPLGTYESVRDEVRRIGLDPATVMPGYVTESELANAYARAAVVVVPSRFEAASFPIWESFARGVPVIAADTTALPAQVGDGGLIFRGGDSQHLTRLLTDLLRDPQRRRALGVAGHARASQFTWVRTALATSALYRHIVGAPPRPEELTALTSEPRL